MSKIYRSMAKNANVNATPQSAPIAGREADMAPNSAGGYGFKISNYAQLERFLILGSEGNTYYASGRELTEKNAKNIIALAENDGVAVVNKIVEISDAGRAPKNEPALFALALVMTYGDEKAKHAAYEALPKVARIGTHVLHLAEYVNSMRGWGRGIRRAFGNWYLSQTPKGLATNLVKYANRDGWTHRDILRLSHPHGEGVYQSLLAYAADKPADFSGTAVEQFMASVAEIKALDSKSAKKAAELIRSNKLPREVVPTELLNSTQVWDALLPHMGITALVRNVATLTRLGMLTPMSDTEKFVIGKLTDKEVISKGRVHPIQMLSAMTTYNNGRGARGNNVWTPNARITAALEDGFYAAFGNVVPTGKNFYLALDVSSSMTWGEIAGVPGLSPNIASTVMAMVTARTEQNYFIRGFSHQLVDLNISAKDTLAQATRKTTDRSFGGTDCAQPMLDALKQGMKVDTFVVYTDSETWAGNTHPSQALKKYRKETGINARLVVVGMTATDISIADPKDGGMLDVVGFDSAAPNIISDFSRGNM